MQPTKMKEVIIVGQSRERERERGEVGAVNNK